MPDDDLKGASQVAKKREYMDLQLLDLRENQIAGSIKQFTTKFLKNTVILCEDNSISQAKIESQLETTKIYSGLHQGAAQTSNPDKQAYAETGFNPFAIVR